ncbi:hypothetical protein TWF481_000298 [Arthrobotrys musiformis]|uniref:Uncharacterized protein n=1 Tax=Arthrobotrys musiformis TaxID=47236 RepID=A0AAV9WT00_9PEZI
MLATKGIGDNSSKSDTLSDSSNRAQTGAVAAQTPPQISQPSISIPKGGGAIRGIGEKFSANPVTGTSSLSVPIATSPGRSGFGPQLSLSYDSGHGNGPFGMGWHLSSPTITRKTDKGLPQYKDAVESDIFLLSDAEDLVPLYKRNAKGDLIRDTQGDFVYDETDHDGYKIRRYGPRIEGMFARIERWTRKTDGDVYWRSITRSNVATIYGKDDNSRIFDPNPASAKRVFSWLICQTYDDKGNSIVYEYKAEDTTGIVSAQANEHNRTDNSRSSNRYLKTIKYGNRTPNRDDDWSIVDGNQLPEANWMFKVVFDYGEHDLNNPKPTDNATWACRQDSFSSYRAGFEIRTYRLCKRVLNFHCFPNELGTAECLVHSTDFSYEEDPVLSFITSVISSGYSRKPGLGQNDEYFKKSLPPVEFEYSKPPSPNRLAQLPVEEISYESLQNIPYGIDNTKYEWVDLDGEGLSGIFTAQAEGWFYKRNLSANNQITTDGNLQTIPKFGPIKLLNAGPNAYFDKAQFMDLAGDGQQDLVQLAGTLRGFYERTDDGSWENFATLVSWPSLDYDNPNLKFVDLNGDGHADILVTENEIFTWYQSLAEDGYGPAKQVSQPFDEEKGPRLVFADAAQSIYLADFSGDGLTDIARIRNGDICYWPNLGYGCFGAKVAMDNAPWFDKFDTFNQQRIILADIDGSGATDIIYTGGDGIDIYCNQSGNGWSEADHIPSNLHADSLSHVAAIDLLGNGTICLVWSSQLPGDNRQSLRYLDLMDGQKPHLMVRTTNNLGAETRVKYAPSTYFYLNDKDEGRPWITKLAFPVHCVQQIETYDHINRNRFVSRYAYHHGYFDGVEREFRGFGMVEQWDTEELGSLGANPALPSNSSTINPTLPPVHTKSWFHTGIFLNNQEVSRHMAREYYGASELDDTQFEQYMQTLLDDTVLPSVEMTTDEMRQAFRALKGSMLRQEIYSDDKSNLAGIPYSVSESNFKVELLQSQGGNRYSIFYTHSCESLSYQYDRNMADPRIQHQLTLDVDQYGNILKSVTVGYGRKIGLSPLQGNDKAKQEQLLMTYNENDLTNVIDNFDDYRTPLVSETRTYQITGFTPATDSPGRFTVSTFDTNDHDFAPILGLKEIPYEQESNPALKEKRLLSRSRILYRSDDLTKLLDVGKVESRALAGESYKLVFTPGILSTVYKRGGEDLIPDPTDTLGGLNTDKAGYIDLDNNGYWWTRTGRSYFNSDPNATAQLELAEARRKFFLAKRFVDAFGHSSIVEYDNHLLLPVKTKDALDNIVASVNDYRSLQPKLVTDPNGNRTEAAFDALGMVVGTAAMGKTTENLGDSLVGFRADLTETEMQQFFSNPKGPGTAVLLGNATSRIIYDLASFWLDVNNQKPTLSATIARETHASDPLPPGGLKFQVGFSYSDGFGREIQKKAQSEPGPLQDGGTVVNQRWVASGWTVFNNKGKPVRQYESFFDDTHDFKFANEVGVSPITIYDSIGRRVATIHPDHKWEKIVISPWQQDSHDVVDTVTHLNPKADKDVGYFLQDLQEADYLPTWYGARKNGQKGADELSAAIKAAANADTPAVTHFDALGRTILTVVDNGADGKYETRVNLDISGNRRELIDAKNRLVIRIDYDMIATQIHQSSMDAGERWTLNDVMGKPFMTWDLRGHEFRTVYDELRRPITNYFKEGSNSGLDQVVGRTVYGETENNPEAHNQRGKAILIFDQAGILTSGSYDFKGNLLDSQRQFSQEYKSTLDWSAAVPLEGAFYKTSTRFDALNRAIEMTSPDNSTYRPIYNEGNLLDQVLVNLRGEQDSNGDLKWQNFVTNIEHDAKGQRTLIEYGNGVRTTYSYDPLTFRLSHLQTARGSDSLQDLYYTYDPIGNITHIRDDAQQTIFFRNRRVEPSNDYTYDAIYRLIEATGREHLGQTNGQVNAPTPPGAFDGFPSLDHPGDGKAMGTYVESYTYDSVGNISSMKHRGSDPSAPGWTRTYNYNEPSQLDISAVNNRLSFTTVGTTTETYGYAGSAGVHGLMTAMPALSYMQWDFKDQLQATAKQIVTNGNTPEITYYVYDNNGQRVRKVTDRQSPPGQAPTRMKERTYLGSFEIYREYGNDGTTVSLERETYNITDDKQRIAMVETRTIGIDPGQAQLIRYQFSNHLSSATLELDDTARIISYEEYTPYGSTSYQAVSNQTEAPKRYRYTGKERDDENGLYYCGARYYAPWIGRWISADPKGVIDGTNVFGYAKDNPILYNDPTGTECDSTLATCVDPTTPTDREEKAQASLPEDVRNEPLPPPEYELGPRGERIPTADWKGGPLKPVDQYKRPMAHDLATMGNYEAAELAENYLCASCHILTKVNPKDFNLRGYVNSWEEGYIKGFVEIPLQGTVGAGWDLAVSAQQAWTGEATGLHISNISSYLVYHQTDEGVKLTNGQRALEGVVAAVGIVSLAFGGAEILEAGSLGRGGMTGANVGRIAPVRPISAGTTARLTRAIGNRMRALGIPEEHIGIPMDGGKAYNPLGQTVGSNQIGQGINVDAAILGDFPHEPWPAFNQASLSTRVDATIAHEFEELGTQAYNHPLALQLGPKTQLQISPAARDLLKDMLKNQIGVPKP